jgi:hypothetical protein
MRYAGKRRYSILNCDCNHREIAYVQERTAIIIVYPSESVPTTIYSLHPSKGGKIRIYTITGNLSPSTAGIGLKTFRKRQSSFPKVSAVNRGFDKLA